MMKHRKLAENISTIQMKNSQFVRIHGVYCFLFLINLKRFYQIHHVPKISIEI